MFKKSLTPLLGLFTLLLLFGTGCNVQLPEGRDAVDEDTEVSDDVVSKDGDANEDAAGDDEANDDVVIAEINLAAADLLDTSDWLTYRNGDWGFEVKYPKEWKVEERPNMDPNAIRPFYNDGLTYNIVTFYVGQYPWNNPTIRYGKEDLFMEISIDNRDVSQNDAIDFFEEIFKSDEWFYELAVHDNPQNSELSKQIFDSAVSTFTLL